MPRKKQEVKQEEVKAEPEPMEPFAFAGKIRNFLEKSRVAVQVHLTHLEKKGKDDPLARRVLPALESIEGLVESEISAVTRKHGAWKNWARQVKGCSPLLLGAIMSRGKIEKMVTTSKLWAHYGFRPGQKPVPGEKLTYDATGRVWCHRMGDSLLMANGCFKKVYDDRKAYEERKAWQRGQTIVYRIEGGKKAQELEEQKRHAEYAGRHGAGAGTVIVRGKNYKLDEATEIAALHVHNRALRYMIKTFLACLYQVWRQAEGLEAVNLYVHDKLDHTGHYPPERFVDYTPEEADAKGR